MNEKEKVDFKMVNIRANHSTALNSIPKTTYYLIVRENRPSYHFDFPELIFQHLVKPGARQQSGLQSEFCSCKNEEYQTIALQLIELLPQQYGQSRPSKQRYGLGRQWDRRRYR